MANELRHADVGTALSKAEWEAVGSHIFNNQAAGDIPYASSTSQLSRLGIGSAKQILSVNSAGTAPEWVSSPAVVTALVPDAADGATIGTAALEFSDVYLADGAVVYFGNDQDVSLTHVADTGLLLNSTMAIQFNDASQYINAPTNAILDINATDEIELNATLADVNANLDVSGTYTGGGLMTTGGNIVIPNAGNIGSASDTDAIAISSGGVVTMNQIPVFSAGINVSGGTIAGTLATAAQANVTSLGTLTTLTVDNIIINGTNIGHTSDTDSIAIASDGVVTMNQIPVFSAGINVSGGTIAGTLATAAQGNVTSLGTLTALTVDNVSINGTTIGHTSDTDLMTLADGVLTIAGEISTTTLDIGGTNVTTTAAELNVIDGDTARGTTAIADGDGVLINDAGTMRMTSVETLATYIEGEIDAFGSAATFSSTLTVGSDGSGQDVTFYSGTSGDHFVWDASEEKLTITGTNGQTALDVADGNVSITDDLSVDGTANLDAVDIDGAVQLDATFTVGVDDTGYDAKFFGAATGKYMLWDESEDYLFFPDNTKAVFGTGADLQIYHDASDSYIDDAGTGILFLRGNSAVKLSKYTGEALIDANADGSVVLYYDDSAKLTTHTSGVEITGSLEVATIDYTDGDLAMTIADGGAVTFAQKVGIGTSSPVAQNLHLYTPATTGAVPIPMLSLEVSDDGADTAAGEGPAINFYIADSTTDSTGSGTIYARKGAGNSHLAGQIATVRISPTDAVGSGDMTFATAENAGALAEHMRIGSDGYVGIATTDPDTPLHIRVADENLALLKLEADMGTNNNRILTIKAPSTDSASEPFIINTGNALSFTIDDSEKIEIDSSGITTFYGEVKYGVDDTGVDVTFFGATSGRDMKWDESDNRLEFKDNTYFSMGDGVDLLMYHTGSAFTIDNNTGNFNIRQDAQDADTVFYGNDGGSQITAMYFDMSNAGRAIFNESIQLGADGYIAFGDTNHLIDVNTGYMLFKMPTDEDFYWQQGSTNAMYLDTSGVTLYLGVDDDTAGHLTMYGSSSGEGAQITMYMDDGNDGTDEAWIFDVAGTNLRQFLADGTMFQYHNADNDFTHFAKKILVNDTADGDSTLGITINQGANDDNILGFKSSDVAHGMTTICETDTYAEFSKMGAADGGLRMNVLGESGYPITYGIFVYGGESTSSTLTSEATSSNGLMRMQFVEADGTGTKVLDDDTNMLVMSNGGSTTRFIFKGDGNAYASGWNSISDGRLKTNQQTIPYGMAEIKQLQPKSFDRHDGHLDDGNMSLSADSERNIGFIAQEVKAIIPEIVKDVNEQESFYHMDDGKLMAIVVKALQELNSRVETLEGA